MTRWTACSSAIGSSTQRADRARDCRSHHRRQSEPRRAYRAAVFTRRQQDGGHVGFGRYAAFPATPFDVQDGIFRICFAGRLDEFKDPPLMFDVLARLHAKLEGNIEFHYVGATDPARYPEFAKAQAFTLRHGSQTPDGVRDIMARCHAGILTSYFEGLPCYLLEMLASGRPVGARLAAI